SNLRRGSPNASSNSISRESLVSLDKSDEALLDWKAFLSLEIISSSAILIVEQHGLGRTTGTESKERSHTTRTPDTTMQGSTDILVEGAEKPRDDCQRARDQHDLPE